MRDAQFAAAEGQCEVRWYAAQARPRRERIALWNLQNQGFEAFCPYRRRTKKVGRQAVMALDPFFPGYLFVKLDLERQRWRSVNGTVGVLRLVGFSDRGSGRPAALPVGLVEHFQRLSTNDSGELRFQEILSAGDRVRVMGGPLDQLCGTLERSGDAERVTILLDILSKETRVRLPRDMLVAA